MNFKAHLTRNEEILIRTLSKWIYFKVNCFENRTKEVRHNLQTKYDYEKEYLGKIFKSSY